MITTQQLSKWRADIICTLENAAKLADHWKENAVLHAYYSHVLQTADAQLALIQRLIIESTAGEVSK